MKPFRCWACATAVTRGAMQYFLAPNLYRTMKQAWAAARVNTCRVKQQGKAGRPFDEPECRERRTSTERAEPHCGEILELPGSDHW